MPRGRVAWSANIRADGGGVADSAHASFWDARYRASMMPWDAGGVPSALRAFADDRPRSERVLVPGCGSAYEAAYLLDRGWDVLAIDFSPAAIALAGDVLGQDRSCILREADFFSLSGAPFDVIYERAFLCALPPRTWPAYAEHVARLTRPGGLLAGFFYLAETSTGPPFGISQRNLIELLGAAFEQIADDPVSDSLSVFAGHERWQIWRRIDDRLPVSLHDDRERPD